MEQALLLLVARNAEVLLKDVTYTSQVEDLEQTSTLTMCAIRLQQLYYDTYFQLLSIPPYSWTIQLET